ncbi:MAG: 16S rRNA (guanine(527)-N(7))-methyltransferase RsmG [Cellulomonadaceae bacterium]|jgi:16S rRNA (guanine527-N7)-methyltransferase|nr:16S rRNA (guanine(527)-N(7))-methyltransferase RsmG [Cellulomonadaceae bacterium]
MSDDERTPERQDAGPLDDGRLDAALGERDDVRALFGGGYDRVRSFYEHLFENGEPRGLIGPREPSRLWERHLINSAAVAQFLPEFGSLLDIGSGAGFPGVVLAIMRPDMAVTLVEPMQRRCDWLGEIVDICTLKNVTVTRARAQEVDVRADVVTSRAVAKLSSLARMSLPLVNAGGSMIALKGRNAEAECAPAASVIRKLGGSPPRVMEAGTVKGIEPTYVVRVDKLP